MMEEHLMRRTVMIIAAVVGLSGCAQPLLDIPEPTEAQRTSAQTVLETTRIVRPRGALNFDVILERLDRVPPKIGWASHKVCKRLKPRMESLRCGAALASIPRVLNGNQINAYADEHDNIGVFFGLVKAMQTDAELAAVLAHEFAHVMLGHVEKKAKNAAAGLLIGGALAGLYGATTYTDPSAYSESWMRTGMLAGSRAYSPEMEIEADRLAVYILNEAGYPPTAMRDVIVRMHRITPARKRGLSSPSRAGFLDTHPSNDRRIAHILSAIHDVRAGVPVEANARE